MCKKRTIIDKLIFANDDWKKIVVNDLGNNLETPIKEVFAPTKD